MTKIAIRIAACSVALCSGFVPQQPFHPRVGVSKASTALEAKATKKKKKKTVAAAGGGFGKVPEKAPPKPVDDFAVFPALEQQVSDTLLATPTELVGATGELPLEVYDRLGQIYGFPNFNYEAVEQPAPLSFDELISSSSTSSDATSPTAASASSLSDTDFSDLLSAATGGESSVSTSTPTVTEATEIDSLSGLPPFSQFRVLHMDPLVIAVDDFLTDEECDRYIALSTEKPKNKKDGPYQTQSKTVGKDAKAKSQRTSTTWFHHYKNVPELMAKASRLVGLDGIDQWEEPQTVRYRKSEKFTWHLDALSPTESTPESGGQRIATLLVYLTDLDAENGGATIFRDLSGADGRLKVQPKKGSALMFFPSAGGIPNAPLDIRTLHCGEVVDEACVQDKWISQLWLRESQYTPSAPAGNAHAAATSAISEYCDTH